MQFLTLPELQELDYHTDETRSLNESLTARIEQLEQGRTDLTEKMQAHQCIDVEAMSPETCRDAEQFKFDRIKLLNDEFELREDLAEWFDIKMQNASAQCLHLNELQQELIGAVSQSLEDIGFIGGSYESAWVMKHPQVAVLSAESHNAVSISSNGDHKRLNEKCLQQVREEMETFRKKLAA